MLNSAMTAEYFAVLAGRFSKRDKYTKIFLSVMSSSTVAGWAIWNDAQQFPYLAMAWRIGSGIAAITSILLPFLNYSKKVEWATTLKVAYDASVKDYEFLWLKRELMTKEQVLDATQDVINKEKSLSAIESNFPEVDKALLSECQKTIKERRGIK